jgi:hypothetical protein
LVVQEEATNISGERHRLRLVLLFGGAAFALLLLVGWRASPAGAAPVKGGVHVSDQSADVTNAGGAVANSGGNVAVGNASRNRASNDQTAVAAGDPVASNVGGASNDSDGHAAVVTGDASATGNSSHTSVHQVAKTSGRHGGISVSNQSARVTNAGFAIANTGGNVAVGNASRNRARNSQTAVAVGDDAVASNIGGASNWSDGSAAIVTGSAPAVGNDSSTHITQVDLAGHTHGGVSLSDQDADVVNLGFAAANSGLNLAVGNVSRNRARNSQDAIVVGLDDDLAVASNVGGASNSSDGSAVIVTGPALAVGNLARNCVLQLS